MNKKTLYHLLLFAGSLLITLYFFNACFPTPAPLTTGQAQEDVKLQSDLPDDLTTYLAQNFSGTSWYQLIDRVSVSVNAREREFSVTAHTGIYPDSDAPRSAIVIAGALKGWALDAEKEHQIELQNLAVFGVRGGVPVQLREWSILWGWR